MAKGLVEMEKGVIEERRSWCSKLKPYLLMVIIQVGSAGMTILSKLALSDGMSVYTFTVYRRILAAIVILPFAIFFERKSRPAMTPSVLLKIVAIGVAEPILDQDLFYLGLKYTSANFAANMSNLLPVITFILAWILRLEKVNFREMGSKAKMAGTILSFAGATVVTLYNGPKIASPLHSQHHHGSEMASAGSYEFLKGAIFMFVAIFSWACTTILQAFALQEFPAEFTLAFYICIAGAVPGTVMALVMEHGNAAAWAIGWNTSLLVIVYAAVISTGMTYCIQGTVMKERGPVFVTAFSPLEIVITAVVGLLCLGQALFLGGVVGVLLIILGLYMVLWGKQQGPTTDE